MMSHADAHPGGDPIRRRGGGDEAHGQPQGAEAGAGHHGKDDGRRVAVSSQEQLEAGRRPRLRRGLSLSATHHASINIVREPYDNIRHRYAWASGRCTHMHAHVQLQELT